MNYMHDVLLDSLERFLQSNCKPQDIRLHETGAPVHALWQRIEEQGYANALLPEDAGGAALGLSEIRPLILLIGHYLLPVPLAETMVARALLQRAGASIPSGAIILVSPALHGDQLVDSAVPLAQAAEFALVESNGCIILTALAGADVVATGVRGSLAADVCWRRDPEPLATLGDALVPLRAVSATLRAALMVGVMGRLLDITLAYANTREQFGRPIGKFQVIQQHLAVMAELLLGADMAVQLAFGESHFLPQPALAALAKQRASEAVTDMTAIAHAVHGAIGLSEEYDLQLYVRRLHEWRIADGSESYWALRLGEICVGSPNGTLQFIIEHLMPKAQPS